MNQVSMSSVDLNDPEAGFTSTTSSLRESSSDALDVVAGEGVRYGIVIGKSHWARGYDVLPAPGVFGNRSVAFPWPVGTGLAPGMRQLHPSYTALLMNKPDDPGQWFIVIVTPDAKVLRADAGLGKNGSRLVSINPAPPTARLPRCMKCQSFAYPSVRSTGTWARRTHGSQAEGPESQAGQTGETWVLQCLSESL